MGNGPTEFVLGTHILENDDYDRSKIETPTAPAGSPVIFDYRTGHRGLGNSTEEVRPILYITYSANGKFSDKVNFDNKCFHKLGEMVAKPKGRDERLKERAGTRKFVDGKWLTEEDLLQAAIKGELKKEDGGVGGGGGEGGGVPPAVSAGVGAVAVVVGEGAKPTPMEGVTPTPVAQPAAPAPPPAATTNMEGVAPLAPTLAPAMD